MLNDLLSHVISTLLTFLSLLQVLLPGTTTVAITCLEKRYPLQSYFDCVFVQDVAASFL